MTYTAAQLAVVAAYYTALEAAELYDDAATIATLDTAYAAMVAAGLR